MWKPKYRLAAADRSGLRYPSDLIDAEWGIIEPMIPPAKHGGRKRTIDVREILNGIFYVLSTGCQWQALPKDLPPKSTVWAYFDLWTWDGTLERIHHALYVAVREQAGREASELGDVSPGFVIGCRRPLMKSLQLSDCEVVGADEKIRRPSIDGADD